MKGYERIKVFGQEFDDPRTVSLFPDWKCAREVLPLIVDDVMRLKVTVASRDNLGRVDIEWVINEKYTQNIPHSASTTLKNVLQRWGEAMFQITDFYAILYNEFVGRNMSYSFDAEIDARFWRELSQMQINEKQILERMLGI